ncbi:hypothetical protein ACGFJ7_04415 [Actinoplanes sp. NPDC048988]|uniref:hypothetical protein n=1 Tax=Actinoplanes sp. NPDC048988 TaxID=3363901 RepID=UPI003722C193
MKAWLTAITATATLVMACVVAASGQQGTPDEQAMVLTHGDRDDSGSVRLSLTGQPVTSLYPGATRRIKVSVVNPFDFPLTLGSLDARVVGTARRDCPATPANLRVGDYNGRLPVAVRPHQRVTLSGSIAVTMPRGATPKCANTKFTIALTGTGWKAGR